MGELVKNNCGTRIGDRIQFTRDEEEYEEYGVTQCKKFISLTYIARIGVFHLRSLLYPCLSAPAENFPSVGMNISIEIPMGIENLLFPAQKCQWGWFRSAILPISNWDMKIIGQFLNGVEILG